MTVAVRDDLLGHLARCLEVVEAHRQIDARRDAVHQLHHRNARHLDHFQGARRVMALRQDQAVDIVRKQRGQTLFFTLRQVAIVRQHSLVVVRVGDAFDAAQHFGEHLVGQRRQQHANRPAGGVGEDVRRAVGDVAQLIQRDGDFLLQGGRNLVGIAQITAHRHLGHAHLVRHILEYRPFFLHYQ